MVKENKTNRGRKPKTTDYNSVFAQRFRKLIKEANITLPELAEKIGATRQSIGQWKDGNTIPNILVLKRIAEYFKVTSDYLIGLSDYETKGAADIGAVIGLSDENIKALQDFHDKETYIYNTIDTFNKSLEANELLERFPLNIGDQFILDLSELLKGFTHEARISYNDEGELEVDTKVGQALNDFIAEVLKSKLIRYIADCRRSKLYPFNFTSENVFTTSSELLRYYAEREQFTHDFNKCMDIVKEIIQKCTDYEVYNRSITENAKIVDATRQGLLFKAREARRQDAKADTNKEGDT